MYALTLIILKATELYALKDEFHEALAEVQQNLHLGLSLEPWDTGSIPFPGQWVKDLRLPQL